MDIRRGIALDLREVDGPGEALETLRALHQDAVEELGATHPTTLDLEEEVAFTQGLVGNGIACDAAYRELLPRLNSPVDTPLIEAASRRWINVLREQDPPEPELLENALRDRVDIRVTEFGPQSVETLQARGEWGEHLANTGRDSDAMAVFEEMRAQVTDGGVDALLIDHSRALILCRRHHFADAVELLRSTLSAAEKTQESVSVGGQDPDQVPPQTSIAAAPGMDGPELPEVIRDVRRTLTLALTDMGEMDEAAQIFREDNAEDVTAAERADKLSRAEDLLARHRNVKAALELQELLMEIEPELGEHHPIVHQAHHLQSQAIRRGRKRIWLTAGAAALLVAAVVALIVVL
jgi:tetratricopeptide (TPR) repeat protein